MPNSRSPIPPGIVDEASEWFVLMRDPATSSKEREAFSAWLRASPVHIGAYLDVTQLWSDAARLDSSFETDLEPEFPDNVIKLGLGAGVNDAPAQHPVGQRREAASRSRWRLGLVAGLLIACLIGSGAWWTVVRSPTYATGIGEQRSITLDDGSVVQLNSRSTIAVRLSSTERDVDLIEGQALFQVAHDAARPFIVRSGSMAIRAVGTQFDVNRLRTATVVTVLEGRVQLKGIVPWFTRAIPTWPGAANAPVYQGAALVSAGERATFDHRGGVALETKANVAAATAWLHRELVFQGEPLSEIIEEFNRYSQVPIILADPSLGDMRVNAVFHTTSPESLLRFVSRLDGVQLKRSHDAITIYRTP
jgi:transmembrane sensor